jgi:hypothetical protein
MGKYSIVDITSFDAYEEALAEAERRWNNLSDEEKAKRESFDIFETDDEEEFSFAFADVIKSYKE